MIRLIRKLYPLFIILFLIVLGLTLHDKIVEKYNNIRGVYYIYKGDQAYSADNMGKTIEYYLKGLKLYPKHYEAWFNLGNIYAVHEDYYSAVDAYEKAIEANPKFVLAKMNLGIVLSEDLGFFDDAIAQFDDVTQIDILKIRVPYIYSNMKSFTTNKGYAYFNKGVAFRRKSLYLPLEKQYLIDEYLQEALNAYNKSLEYVKDNYDI